jgi:hypothetical protein
MSMWCTSGDSLKKKEREGMEVLSFMDESRKCICVQQSTMMAEVMFPTCTWESAINVSF